MSKGNSVSTAVESEVVHAYFWGMIEPVIEPNNCHGTALAKVTAKTNFFYSLGTVITLGIWTPMEIQWRCAKDSHKSKNSAF